MRRFVRSSVLLVGVVLESSLASAAPAVAPVDPCAKPAVRSTAPLRQAADGDDALAKAFEGAASACSAVGPACESAKSDCSLALGTTLQKQGGLEDDAFLRDMQAPFQGERFATSAKTARPLDAACGADAATLGAAAARRKELALTRRTLASEYDKWTAWLDARAAACAKTLSTAATAAATTAAASAASVAAVKAAEAARDSERLRNEAAKNVAARAADEAAAREAAAKAAQAAAQASAQALARADEEARAVADREARTQAAESRVKEVQDRADSQLKARKEAHEQKLKALESNSGMSADEREREVAAEKARHAVELNQTQAQSEKELAEAKEYDRSHQRPFIALTVTPEAGYLSLSDGVTPLSGFLLGGSATLRMGLWGTAGVSGLASGLDFQIPLRAATTVGATGGAYSLISSTPEIRYWLSRFGFGVSFDWTRQWVTGPLSFDANLVNTVATNKFALGPTVAFALVDGPGVKFLAAVRWLPIIGWDPSRLSLSLDVALGWFALGAQFATVREQAHVYAGGLQPERTGWSLSGTVGLRL